LEVVEAQEGQPRRIGAPPVSGVFAMENLLVVDPAGLPVKDDGAAVLGDLLLLLGFFVGDVEIVAADGGGPFAIGAGGRLAAALALLRPGGRPGGGVVVRRQ